MLTEKINASFIILKTSSLTLCCNCWPIILLTMLLDADANDQAKHPKIPNMLRMILDMASGCCTVMFDEYIKKFPACSADGKLNHNG